MQPMAKRFIHVICLLVMAGCVTTGNPWDRAPSQTAVAAPSALNRTAILSAPVPAPIQQGAPVLQQAGLEYYGADGRAEIPAGPSGEQAFDGQTIDRAPLMAPTSRSSATAAPGLPSVKVGLLVPLSGPHGALGQAMLQSAQLALFDMGYDSFELLPRDTNTGAQMAAQSAVEAGAQLILGPVFAQDVRAARPVARRYNVNMISFSTDWSLANSNTYVMGFLPFAQVQRIAEYAAMQGYRSIGVLAPENDYGNAVIRTWNAVSYRAGMMTEETVKFPAEQSDVSGIIGSFAHYDAEVEKEIEKGNIPPEEIMPPPYDAVLLPVGGEQARAVANLLSYYNLSPQAVKRLSTGLWDDAGLATEPALAGSWFAAPSPDLRRGFEQRYADVYGQPAPRLATLAYDATALASVLARNGYHRMGRPAFDRESLTNPNGFAGIDGIFRFRTDGLVERGLAVLEFRGGKIVQIDPAPRTFESYSGQ